MDIRFEEFKYSHTKENVKKGFVQFRHSHPHLDVLVCLSGNAHFVIEDKDYSLLPGDILTIGSFEYHTMCFDSDCEYERILLSIENDLLPTAVKNNIPNLTKCTNISQKHELQDILARFETYLVKFSGDERDVLMCGLLHEFMLNLAMIEGAVSAEPVSPVVSAVVDYVNANLTSKLTLDCISDNIHISKSYMNFVFSQKMGIGIMKYVRIKKIAIAHKLIGEGKKATDVAYMLGFDEYSTFYRLYKERYSAAPSKSEK